MQEILNRYIDYLRVGRNASPYTVRNYYNSLVGNNIRGTQKGFFPFLITKKIDSLEKVNKQTLRDYIMWLMEQRVAKTSITCKLSAIRSFYVYLQKEGLIQENPMEKISSPKLDRRLPSYLTNDEINRFLLAPDISTPTGQRDRAILELLYASGLRVSELVHLKLSQIDMDTREIRVVGKSSKERLALMGKPAADAIAVYLQQGRPTLLGKKKSEAVFINRYGQRLIERRIQKIVTRYTRITGITKKVHPHTLRHTFATHLLDGGADLRVVQELLGHASLTTTQIYTHVSQSQARKVYLAAHPLAKEKKTDD
ncbi:MAG: tyrosine recombinase XerC [Chloroflexi bacterium]|nr:tyrosine recombinase XerC [Chloroflexota bacterium]